MMSNEGVPFVLLSIASCFSLVILAAICVCGCRKKVPKNELLGLEGMVKITNPDENVNNVTVIDQPSGITENKIKSIVEPLPRRLPPIPNDSDALVPEIETNAAGDTGSDIYATVGHKVQTFPQGSPNTCNKHPSGLERPSLSQHSSLSQGDDISSTYATVKSPHAYDKVGRSEHAYATLHSGSTTINNAEETTTGVHEHSTMLDPLAPSRSRRASTQSLASINGQNNTAPTVIDISAAPAIAGRVSANQELPYMTPPLIAPQHFSGDSQDSSKGYTSISVREPLAILAQSTQGTSNGNRRIDRPDSHYATVSDDSDEMYAAIDDPNPQSDLYTSGSETYAQIQPPIIPVDITTVPVATTSSLDTNISIAVVQHQSRHSQISSSDSDAPHPPSVNNLRHLAQVHSRQASSSSCNSSVVNLGSPKPEKRQANSPLPPPPANLIDPSRTKFNILGETSKHNNTIAITRNSTSDLYDIARLGSTSDKHRRNYSSMSHNELQGLKKYTNESTQIDKSKLLQEAESTREVQLPSNENTSSTCSEAFKNPSPAKTLEEMYAKVVKKNKNLSNFNEKISVENSDNTVSNVRDTICNNVPKSKDLSNNESIYGSDPEIGLDVNLDLYNKNILPHGNQGGDASCKSKVIDPSYETIKKTTLSEKDPGYETIGKNVTPVDPGYETLKDRSKSFLDSQHPDHNASSSIRYSYNSLRPGTLAESLIGEPGYESLPGALDSLANDPGYEAIQKSRFSRPSVGSDCDPNYEVLRHTTANTRLHDMDVTNTEYSSFSDVEGAPNYSSIKEVHSDGYSSISEVKSNLQDNDSLIQAGYSVVNKKIKSCGVVPEEPNYESMPTNYTTGSESDPNYESVKYLDLDTEPPYERLHNESPAAHSALSNNEHNGRDQEGNLNDNSDCTDYETVDNKNETLSQKNAKTDNIENVDDYFQV